MCNGPEAFVGYRGKRCAPGDPSADSRDGLGAWAREPFLRDGFATVGYPETGVAPGGAVTVPYPAASVCFHRALLCLIPAVTLTWVAIRGTGGPLIVAVALIAGSAGCYWLWRGSRQLAAESGQRRR